jgi:hypothetical protein
MRNLLESPLDATAIATIFGKERHPLLPPLDAPEWDTVREKSAVLRWLEAIQGRVEEEASVPLPELTDELYADFFKTGRRLPFEKVFAERRRRLGRAAMAVLLGNPATQRKLVPGLLDKIGGIVEEPSWSLPAHVWTEPTGKNPLQIDLTAADTANLMGELISLFGSLLPEELDLRIRERLRVQIFENYLERHAEFTWTTLPMNWNAVCHHGVLGAALAVEEDSAVVGRLLAIASGYLPLYLSGFGKDGSTSEGPGYWGYGFGRFAWLNEQLETASGGALSFFGDSQHVRRIAQFAPALVLSNNYLVNFSDGNREGTLEAALLEYLGKRLGLPGLRKESVTITAGMAKTPVNPDTQPCDVLSLTRRFLWCQEPVGSTEEPARPDSYFEDYGAVVARGRDASGNFVEFAAKAGHNNEHHNHNDCGSFIFHLNGEPAVIEIGAPEYVRGFFGHAGRYQFLAARSLGHSVPYVNRCEQSEGKEFTSAVLECVMDSRHVKFVVDLTEAYSTASLCRKLVRTFEFDKSTGRLGITDAFEFDKPRPIESMVICDAPVTIEEAGARIDAPGGVVRLVSLDGAVVAEIDAAEYNDRTPTERQVNRIGLRPGAKVASGVIRYELRPA